mmetsp:Transcript_127406/g.224349  ORF Transcript_127406/g.224349 Transcript_127406/m.224349 type:complete len:332 (-) Transcript_127406:67-1062(-)
MTVESTLLTESANVATPAVLSGAALSGGADSVLFESPFAGPELEEGWQWVREDSGAWSFQDAGLALKTTPGGIWGSVFADLPAPSLLLRPTHGSNACEVTVTMPSPPGGFGEQAGLFWYRDDSNYAKLVVEWMKDGTANVVLAQERRGAPVVCATAPLDAEEACEAVRLRLELSADGCKLSGVIVGAFYMRLVGTCEVEGDMRPDQSEDATQVLIGVSAHGGTAEGVVAGRAARFTNFSAIAIRPNRVQWTGGAGRAPAPIEAPAALSPALLHGFAAPAPGEECAISAAPALPTGGSGGWTLSEDLTEEQRAQIAILLAQNSLPPLDDPSA